MNDSPLVRLTIADQVATIVLDSPHNRNALSRRLQSEFLRSLELAADDPDARVVLIQSSGRVFCSGADLTEAATDPMADAARRTIALQRALVASKKPVVVRLDGPVRAGGIGIIASADIVIASSNVDFALTEVRLALAPAIISLTLLPRLSSRGAADVLLTGRTFSASEAREFGLLTHVAEPEDLDCVVQETVDQLRLGHPQGLGATKDLLVSAILNDIDARGEALAELSAELFASESAQQLIAHRTRSARQSAGRAQT